MGSITPVDPVEELGLVFGRRDVAVDPGTENTGWMRGHRVTEGWRRVGRGGHTVVTRVRGIIS